MTRQKIAQRFRSFLPVVIDVETGGFDARKDALLEIAAVIIRMNHAGVLEPAHTVAFHVEPFPGAGLNPESLAVNGINPHSALRGAVSEDQAITTIFREVRRELKETGCNRAILVGHNAFFDLSFLQAAIARNQLKRNPFHQFSCFDTVTAGGIFYGQTVLAKAVAAAGIAWNEREAHSAVYDAKKTAEFFCHVINRWKSVGGWL